MISLKRYLDSSNEPRPVERHENSVCDALLRVYCNGLVHMREGGVDACPDLGPELSRGVKRIIESIGTSPTADSMIASEASVRELLRGWGRRVASHYGQKATDVRDLLIIMSRTAESLGNKDDRIARRLDRVTEQLTSIASLEDLSRMRASIEESARELRQSLEKISAEGKALVEHLRAEVSTYQTKLEKAERVSSCDTLTGLGSRHWVEGRIEERIDSGTRFSIVLIDIDEFHSVVEAYGNLVGDLVLKEFARELRSSCRFTDIVGRWGNDEFMIILDEVGTEIRSQLERLRLSVSKRYHVPGRTGYVNIALTVALGLAEHRSGEDVQAVLERADSDLCRQRGKVQKKTA